MKLRSQHKPKHEAVLVVTFKKRWWYPTLNHVHIHQELAYTFRRWGFQENDFSPFENCWVSRLCLKEVQHAIFKGIVWGENPQKPMTSHFPSNYVCWNTLPALKKKDARNSHGFFRLSPPVWWGFRSFHNGISMNALEGSPTQRLKDVPFSHTKRGFVSLGFVAMASSSSRTRLSKGQELSRAFRGIDGCMDGVKCKGNVETTSTPNISCKIGKNICKCIYRNTRHPLRVNDKERHIFDFLFFFATGKSIRKRDASVGTRSLEQFRKINKSWEKRS